MVKGGGQSLAVYRLSLKLSLYARPCSCFSSITAPSCPSPIMKMKFKPILPPVLGSNLDGNPSPSSATRSRMVPSSLKPRLMRMMPILPSGKACRRELEIISLRTRPQGVGDYLAQDKTAGDGGVDKDEDIIQLCFKADLAGTGSLVPGEELDQVGNVLLQVQTGQILGIVQSLVHQGHGLYAALGFRKRGFQAFIAGILRLQLQHGHYDVHVVACTMV